MNSLNDDQNKCGFVPYTPKDVSTAINVIHNSGNNVVLTKELVSDNENSTEISYQICQMYLKEILCTELFDKTEGMVKAELRRLANIVFKITKDGILVLDQWGMPVFRPGHDDGTIAFSVAISQGLCEAAETNVTKSDQPLLVHQVDKGIGDGKEDEIKSIRPVESMVEKVISELNKKKILYFWIFKTLLFAANNIMYTNFSLCLLLSYNATHRKK